MIKKKHAGVLAFLTGIIAVIGLLLSLTGFIPAELYEGVLIVDFPLFVLSLCLYWMAPAGDEDMPFIGY